MSWKLSTLIIGASSRASRAKGTAARGGAVSSRGGGAKAAADSRGVVACGQRPSSTSFASAVVALAACSSIVSMGAALPLMSSVRLMASSSGRSICAHAADDTWTAPATDVDCEACETGQGEVFATKACVSILPFLTESTRLRPAGRVDHVAEEAEARCGPNEAGRNTASAGSRRRTPHGADEPAGHGPDVDARAQAQPQLGGRFVGEQGEQQRRRGVVHRRGRAREQPAAGHCEGARVSRE